MFERVFVAVSQAGITLLSATHNAKPVRSDSPEDQSGESLESMITSALDEDELFARAAQAREEMRRLKMPRKYGEIKEEGYRDDDAIDDLNSMANGEEDDDATDDDDNDVAEDDDDADVEEEDDDDDDYYNDDSGGLEGAREVGFTAPPKGFKAEVRSLSP